MAYLTDDQGERKPKTDAITAALTKALGANSDLREAFKAVIDKAVKPAVTAQLASTTALNARLDQILELVQPKPALMNRHSAEALDEADYYREAARHATDPTLRLGYEGLAARSLRQRAP